MYLHPGLAALRDDDSPQRAAQAKLQAEVARWRALPGVQVATAELSLFAAGTGLADCPQLKALLTEWATAMGLVAALVGPLCAALADAPLGHAPLRHFTDGTTSTLLLLRAGDATLALTALDGAAFARRPAPTSVSFAPSDSWDLVLAGTARAELAAAPWAATQGPLGRRAVQLSPGSAIARDGALEALVVREVAGCLVSLKLQRRRTGEPACEYSLADGALLHRAAGTARDSRLELMAALLGRMDRADAAPLLAAMAQESGGTALRWQVLRECLALDTRAGFAALTRIARSPADPLALPAGALRAQLIEAHPELEGLEPCR